jgi:outer membrane autotransporter protein
MKKSQKAALLGGASLVVSLAGAISEAQAQANCTNPLSSQTVTFVITPAVPGIPATSTTPAVPAKPAVLGSSTVTTVSSSPTPVVGALVATINNFNTAFLSQGSPFVGNPPAKMETTGGGFWIRGIGGQSNTNLTSTISFNGTSASCGSSINETYGGVQVGADIGKLNLGNSGAYVHFGVTAGYGEDRFSEGLPGTTSGNLQAPFVGVYATYANGAFFADFMARYNTFSETLTEPKFLGLFGQRLDAQGYSVQGSAGYRIDIPNSTWFIEPSAGIIYSNTQVDPLNFGGTFVFGGATGSLPGVLNINNLQSTLGRVGGRIGTNIQGDRVIYQPFVVASVWHDFQANSTAAMNVFGVNGVAIPGGVQSSAISVANVATYGQYSVGIAEQGTDNGLVSYLRVDYRNGSGFTSLGLNGGIRYQFLPDQPGASAFASAAPKMIYKTKAPMAPRPYNWAGLYIGGFSGASWGNSDWGMVSAPQDVSGANVASGTTSPRTMGALAGGMIGYNFQTAPDWIVGIEGDAAWSNQKGSLACPGSLNNQSANLQTFIANPTNPVSFFQCNDDHADPVVTLTGRIGHSFDRVLVFAKGGGAWTQDGYSITFDSPPASPGGTGAVPPAPGFAGLPANFLVRSGSDNRFGWTVGAGFEFGITRQLSAKFEYDYLNFGSKTVVFADPLVPVTASIKESFNQVKVGLSYRPGQMP